VSRAHEAVTVLTHDAFRWGFVTLQALRLVHQTPMNINFRPAVRCFVNIALILSLAVEVVARCRVQIFSLARFVRTRGAAPFS
jgi:hypothetical protein